jgi:L-ascorbate metabolism protein UlaG (beta-lactamase superfamily)
MARSTTLSLGPASADAALDRGSILFVGTATVVAHLGPFTLLTDPNFLHAGDHAHLGYGLRSRRLTEPALDVDSLPPLDACVLSHFHGDHWDEVATARLPKELPVITTAHAARALGRRGFTRAHALETWDDVVLRRGTASLRITAVPGRHGPPMVNALLPPVMGTVWELAAAGAEPRFRLYVSGDTLVHDDLRRIPERYPHLDVGLFHLGGTRVLGVLVTMDAAQGVEAIRILRPDLAIPIHYDDYPVFKSPLEDFARAVTEAGLAPKVRFIGRGERHELTFRGPPRLVATAREPAAPWPVRGGDGQPGRREP